MSPPLVALILGCDAAAPTAAFILIATIEADAPAGFTPSATIEGGQVVVLVLGAAHGSLCDSRITPTSVRSGPLFRLTLTRAFLPPTGSCDSANKKSTTR